MSGRPPIFAGINLAAVPIVTGTITDNARIGTLAACIGRTTGGAGVDTDYPHALGRVPNGYLLLRTASGTTLYDATDGAAHWTAGSIRLRSSLGADTVSFLVW